MVLVVYFYSGSLRTKAVGELALFFALKSRATTTKV